MAKNKKQAKQMALARLCGFDLQHEFLANLTEQEKKSTPFLSAADLTKSDIFDAYGNLSIFEYKEAWRHIDKIADLMRQKGTPITLDDLTKTVSDEETALDWAVLIDSLEDFFSPALWKGQSHRLEEAWSLISKHNRRNLNFVEIKRRIAKAEGVEIREDVLLRHGVHIRDIREAVESGEFEELRKNLSRHGDYLRKEDILTLSDPEADIYTPEDNHMLDSKASWVNFDALVEELARNGERFEKEDFLHKRGGKKSPLIEACHCYEHDKIFNRDLWQGRLDEMIHLYKAVPDDHKIMIDIGDLLEGITAESILETVKVDQNLTHARLTGAQNKEYQNIIDDLHPVRPLGLEAFWEQIEKIKAILARRGEAITLQDLRAVSGSKGETCLMAAVRYGYFQQAMEIIEQDSESLSVSDLITKSSDDEHSVLTLLIENDDVEHVLRPELWAGRVPDLFQVWKEIPAEAKDDLRARGITLDQIRGDIALRNAWDYADRQNKSGGKSKGGPSPKSPKPGL